MSQYWTRDEYCRIVAAAERLTSVVDGTPSRLLFAALFYFVYDTAIEPYTLLGIRSEWLNFVEGKLWLPAVMTDSNREQEFQLRPQTLLKLKLSGAQSRSVLFPWRVKLTGTGDKKSFGAIGFHSACEALLQEAGLPPGAAHVGARRLPVRAWKLWRAVIAHHGAPGAVSATPYASIGMG